LGLVRGIVSTGQVDRFFVLWSLVINIHPTLSHENPGARMGAWGRNYSLTSSSVYKAEEEFTNKLTLTIAAAITFPAALFIHHTGLAALRTKFARF